MVVRFSTGLRAALATDYGLGAMMDGGWIALYDNELPDSPDQPPGASSVARITDGGRVFVPVEDPYGAGLRVQFLRPCALRQQGHWVLTGQRAGTARWFRWYWRGADDLGYSEYAPRIDGDIGGLTSRAAMRLASVRMTASTTFNIDTMLLNMARGSA